jgi:hypothetical protein
MLGPSEGFMANHLSRFYKADNATLKKQLYVVENMLRTVDNYEEDLLTNEIKLTGI